MKTRPLSFLRPALGLSVALLLAACSAGAAGGWTFVPPAGTPAASGAPASGAPAASAAASAPAGGASAAPGASMPGMSMAPGASGAPAASGGTGGGTAGGNVITLDETASLQITDPNGQQVKTITVKKGETYHFKITNSAGFTHNFYVGKVSDLEAANAANLTGTGDFTSGTKEFDYTFNDTQDIGFGCIVPGHYQAGMAGTFTVQ